jgi:3-isopropylmalate dehydratase small subunit
MPSNMRMYKNGGKVTKKGTAKKAVPMATVVIETDEPTPKELARMRQRMKEKEMDEGTYRGAKQYEGPDFPVPVNKAKGGMVTKGNGIAIRGTRKCKMY